MNIIRSNEKKRLLANTSAQTESLLHSLEQAARGIGFSVCIQIKQTPYVFKSYLHIKWQTPEINRPVHMHSMYIGSNISSTERDVNICIGKA